jgi:hypothetical protein
MRLAWVSLALALTLSATACGAKPTHMIAVTGIVSAGGLEITLREAILQDEPLPYREGPPGSHCAVYALDVRSIDGNRHELRPSEFESAGATPADGVARCGSPQLEPTWIDRQSRTVTLTILEGAGAPAPLYWRVR